MTKRQTPRLEKDELLAYGLRLLAGRALSAAELRFRLSRRAAHATDIEAVMTALGQYGFTDDHRFAGDYSEARAQSGAFGRQRVLADLLRKRVPRAVAERAVGKAYAGINEEEQARAWLERKFRGKNLAAWLREPRHMQSAFRRLRTAGFSAGASIRALKAHNSAAQALEDSPEAQENQEDGA